MGVFPKFIREKEPIMGSGRGKSRVSAVEIRKLWLLPDREAGVLRPGTSQGHHQLSHGTLYDKGVAQLHSKPPDTQQTLVI